MYNGLESLNYINLRDIILLIQGTLHKKKQRRNHVHGLVVRNVLYQSCWTLFRTSGVT